MGAEPSWGWKTPLFESLIQSSDMQTRRFGHTDIRVPMIGRGTWTVGDRREREREEIAALRLGLDLGMTHIDTAELHGARSRATPRPCRESR